jgi:uncharacterized damage-inducible protein DinB
MSPTKKAARPRRKPVRRKPPKVSRGRKAAGAKRAGASRRRKPVRGKKAAAKRTASARRRRPARAKKALARQRSRKTAARASSAKARAKPRLSAVRRPARKAPPPPAFRQRTSASGKQLVLFELLRARAAVLAAIQGMPAASAEQPLGEGKWSAREVVLHLVARDRVRLKEMEAALRGARASWAGVHDDEMSRLNEADLASLRSLDWEAARRLLHTTRHQLMEAIESVPEEPAEVWKPEHPFGWMLHRLPTHDHHHAEVIKRWRAERGV